jgi:Xaa-Pro aminopeptidase
MERDEAAKTGLETRDLPAFPWARYLQEARGDESRAQAMRLKAVLETTGFTRGRLGITGRVDFGPWHSTFEALQALLPQVKLDGQAAHQALLDARRTKTGDEITHIRRMGQITTEVVGRVADFLSSQRGKDGLLVKADGQPVTIGEVKGLINRWLAELGAENPEGTIFAQGRDAGVPHSTGDDNAPLRLGSPIVFDIFPCEAGGGYFYDFTRTWCLGYAPDEAQALYEDVLSVYRQIMGELQPNMLCRDLQRRTCELFEAQGHPTSCRQAGMREGYVHSLGHGLGLDVHEAPWFRASETNEDRLEPGVVITIEPGLYYPKRGLGCRLEDTVWARPDGTFEVLADFPHDLVLPVKG